MSLVATSNGRIEDPGRAAFRDERPQKRTRHGPGGVDRALEEAAEIVMILAGMSQMRAGQPPGSAELDLAARAFQILRQYVANLPPEELLKNGTVEALIEELGLRKTDKKKDDEKREDDVARAAEEMQKVSACLSYLIGGLAARDGWAPVVGSVGRGSSVYVMTCSLCLIEGNSSMHLRFG